MKSIKIITYHCLTVIAFVYEDNIRFEIANYGDKRLIELFDANNQSNSIPVDIMKIPRGNSEELPVLTFSSCTERSRDGLYVPEGGASTLNFNFMKLESYLLIIGGRDHGAHIKFKLGEVTPVYLGDSNSSVVKIYELPLEVK